MKHEQKGTRPLNPRHRRFIYFYFKTNFNGAKAARLAGYSKNSARQQAWRLLHKV